MELARSRFEIRAIATDPRSGRRKEVRRERDCTLKEAVELQREWAAVLRRSFEAEAPRRIRLKDFARSWLTGRLEKKRLKPSTAAKIASVLDLHVLPAFGEFFVDAIRPADVEKWLGGQLARYEPVTVLNRLRILRTMSRAAKATLRLPHDFCEGVEAPAYEVETSNHLTAEELRIVLEIVERRWPELHLMTEVLAFTGLRWGEVSALKWDDIDEAAGLIRVRRGNWKGIEVPSTKTRKVRTVPLLPHLIEGLREQRRRLIAAQHRGPEAGWVFPAPDGGLHKGYPLQKPLKRALAEAGISRRVTVHGLRHTANDLFRRVASAEVVRSITGHSTVAMFEHYSHVDAREKLVAAGRVFELVTGSRPESGAESGGARTTDDVSAEDLNDFGGAGQS
jgi:integrase